MNHCATCAKKSRNPARVGCRVLIEPIGIKTRCFAWTNNPDWEEDVSLAVEAYLWRRREMANKKKR